MEDEDDKPISLLIAEKKANDKTDGSETKTSVSIVKTENKSTINNGSVSDSDDDLPISEFIKKREREKTAQKLAAEKKMKLEGKNGQSLTTRKSSSDAKNSNGNRNSSSSSSSSSSSEQVATSSGTNSWNSECAEYNFYNTTEKGTLLQAFLRRWWYSYEWPVMSELGEVPKGHEALDGFPGVYVSTRADTLGKIVDKRDKCKCPCLSSFIKKSSAEIKQLCVTAIENQMKQLIEAEGEDCKLVIKLRLELNEIKRIDPNLADKQALPFLNSFDHRSSPSS